MKTKEPKTKYIFEYKGRNVSIHPHTWTGQPGTKQLRTEKPLSEQSGVGANCNFGTPSWGKPIL